MKLSFYGADQCVTGSCHCLEVNGKRILVDCGLQQGRDEVSNDAFPFAANDHRLRPGDPRPHRPLRPDPHADQAGLPGPDRHHPADGGSAWTSCCWTPPTSRSHDAEWKNRKAERSGAPRVEPLYTIEDAQRVERVHDHLRVRPGRGPVRGRHGWSSWTRAICWAPPPSSSPPRRAASPNSIVFSGDIGNVDQPIIRDPTYLTGADYVVMESTYGDRNHTEVWSYTDDLAKIIDETIAKGGNVVIPSFAVGRTQELLYFIREIKDAGDGEERPGLPGVHRLPPGQEGHHHLHRRPAGLSG